MAELLCHCGSRQPFTTCCEKFINASAVADTAEALMRSRYSAYVIGNRDYLLRSWHPQTRPAELHLASDQHWLGLKIKNAEAGGTVDAHGTVEFVARYKIAGKGYRLHEKSQFVRLEGRWVYIDGEQPSRE